MLTKRFRLLVCVLCFGLRLFAQSGEFSNQLSEFITTYENASRDKPNSKDTKAIYNLLIDTRNALDQYQKDSTYQEYKKLQNQNDKLLKYINRFDSENAKKIIFWAESLREFLLKNPKSPENLPETDSNPQTVPEVIPEEPQTQSNQGSIVVQSSPISRMPEMTIVYFLFGLIILLFCITWLNAIGSRKKLSQIIEKKLAEQLKIIKSLEQQPKISPTEITTTQSKLVAIETSIITFFQEVEGKITLIENQIKQSDTKHLEFAKTFISELNQVTSWLQDLRSATDIQLQQLSDKIRTLEAQKQSGDTVPSLKGKIFLPINPTLREIILKIGSETNILTLTHLSQTLGLNNPTQQGDLYALARFAQLSYVSSINERQSAYTQLVTLINQLEIEIDDQIVGRIPHTEHFADNVVIENYRESVRLRSSEFPSQQHVFSEIQQRIAQGNIAKGAVIYVLLPSVFYLKDGLKVMVARGVYILNA